MMRFLSNNYQSDFFHRPLADLMGAIMKEEEMMPAEFTLPVGRAWSDEALHLRFVMPAVSDKDFSLTARGDTLVLKGQRTPPDAFGHDGDVKYALPYGSFERLMTLPPGLDLKRMEAKFHHGVLDLKIPMRDEFKPMAIPVKIDEPAFAEVAAAAGGR